MSERKEEVGASSDATLVTSIEEEPAEEPIAEEPEPIEDPEEESLFDTEAELRKQDEQRAEAERKQITDF